MKTYTKPTILVVAINPEDMIAQSVGVSNTIVSPDQALSKHLDLWSEEEEDQ